MAKLPPSQPSHQVAGVAFEVVEKAAAGSLVDVIGAHRDDDHACGDECDGAATVYIRRALIPEFCAPVDFPAPGANPSVEYANAK
jgi:hypothetical protein